MNAIKLVCMVAITIALVITVQKGADHPRKELLPENNISGGSGTDQEPRWVLPAKRISRFLAAKAPKPRNPNSADHCRKDHHICQQVMPLAGRNATCCNNKCVDLHYNSNNCGACKEKCFPFESCCRGECVNLNFDKRHCGFCNNRCKTGDYCFYGYCGYA